jgi:uncharacterized protein (DUF885 family)
LVQVRKKMLEEEQPSTRKFSKNQIITTIFAIVLSFFSILLIINFGLFGFGIAKPFIFSKQISNLKPIYDEEWEFKMKKNPELATYTNDNRYNSNLTSFSPDSIKEKKDFYKNLQSTLSGIQFSSSVYQEVLSFKLFKYTVDSFVKGSAFPEEYMNIDHLENGPQIELVNTIRDTRFKLEKDYTDFIQRLASLETQIDERIVLLKKGVETG